MSDEANLLRLREAIEPVRMEVQSQLDNIGSLMLPISLGSVAAVIGVQILLRILLLWIPTAFILWLAMSLVSLVQPIWTFLRGNTHGVFEKFGKLSQNRKGKGLMTASLRAVPLWYAGAAIYFLSAVILAVAGAGLVQFPLGSPIALPLVVDVLLIVVFLGTSYIYHRLSPSQLDAPLAFYRKGPGDFTLRHLLLVGISLLFVALLAAFLFFALPVIALTSIWTKYFSGESWYAIGLVIVLQVFCWMLLVGYFTQQLARTELANSVANLTNVRLSIEKRLNSGKVSPKDLSELETQFYAAVRYRFVRQLLFGFIPVYVPVLNQAYLESKAK